MEIPPQSSDEMKESGFTVDTRPFVDPYAIEQEQIKKELTQPEPEVSNFFTTNWSLGGGDNFPPGYNSRDYE